MKNEKPKPGDKVEVHRDKEIYEGFLLESPSSEKGTVLLKLENGYNIGFNKKDIREIKLLEKSKEKEKKVDIKQDKGKPNIAMVITGGTIASRLDTHTGGVSPLTSPEDLFKFYPGVFEVANVVKVEVPFTKQSEDMDFKDWQKLAKTAEKLLNDSNIRGIIITHGTDTLHYTASALSFFLRDLNKPVVLTYSQRSVDRASSDANLNLQCAAVAAISDIAEVMVVGHASTNDDFCYAIRGTKSRKMHTSKRDAFKSINEKPLAKITPKKIEVIGKYNLRKSGKVKADTKFDDKVALVKFYPGQDPKILDYYKKNGYKGIILEASGLGHVPAEGSKNSWIPKLKKYIEKGLIVCITSQCIYGRVDPYVYSNLRKLQSAGAIFLEDMLAETALVKLGWILRHEGWIVKKRMLENYAGEIGDRIEI